MSITEQLHELASQWLVIISDPMILVPLIGGIAVGYMVSISPFISRIKRESDRLYYVYMANSFSAGALFVLTQMDEPIDAVLSMLIVVMSSAIILPWFYFNVYKKKK